MNRRWAQHAPVMRPRFTFGCNLRPVFKFSPHARAGPRTAAVEDEGVSLPAVLVSAQHADILPDPHHAARGRYLSAHVQINVPGPPNIIMLRTQAVGMKSLQAVECPADLAPIHFNC